MPKSRDRLFYGWVVLLSFLIIGITIWGIRFSFGVFFKAIAVEFSLNRAETSAIFSLNILLGGVFAFLLGWALDKHGPRIVIFLMGILVGLSMLLTSLTNASWQLFITYSLLLGAGGGAAFTVINSTLARWFDKRRGLVLGIGASGAGLGPMIMAPLATSLILTFDWRLAFIVMGGIAFVIVLPLSRLLKRDPREIGALPDGVKSDSSDIDGPEAGEGNSEVASDSLLPVLRTRNFWFFLFMWFFYGYNMFLILTHLVPHATDIGFSAVEAAAVLSIVGLMSAVGRVLMGFLSDRTGRKLTAITCSMLQVIGLLFLILSPSLWVLYLFAVVWGLGYGGLTPSTAALISESFSLRRIGSIFGFLDIGFSVGGAVGSFMGGVIFDVSGNYFIAFLIASLAMFIATLLVAAVKPKARRTTEVLIPGAKM